MAEKLRREGAELVVCITHMRLPEDERLCQETKGIDIVLVRHLLLFLLLFLFLFLFLFFINHHHHPI